MTASVTNRYMPAEDVIVYVTERLRTSASRLALPVPDDRGRSTADGERPAPDVGEARPPKKRLGQSLVAFWTGTDSPPDSLNKYILMTARMLRYEVSEDEAIGLLQTYMDEHPDHSFSDRLSSGQHTEVSRVIRNTVRAVYAGNGGQADPGASTRILDKAHAYFQRVGFKACDKTTWDRLGTAVTQLGPDFAWSAEEVDLIRQNLVPVLKTDLATAAGATKHFLRFVQGQAGKEISRDNLPFILKDYELRIRKAKKKSAFLSRLIGLNWLVISKHHQWFARGSGRQGRARQYEIGPALTYKFDAPRQVRNNLNGNHGEGLEG